MLSGQLFRQQFLRRGRGVDPASIQVDSAAWKFVGIGMLRLGRIYKRLLSIKDRSVDQALAEALPTADPQAARLASLMLLQRSDTTSRVALVRYLDRLPSDVQAIIIDSASDLYGPLRKAANQKETRCAENLIRIILRAKQGKLAYLIAEQLLHRPEEVRCQAAACLLALTRHTRPSPRGPVGTVRRVSPFDVDAAHYVQAAVEESVRQFAHHKQPDVLTSLALLAARGIRSTLDLLDDPQHAAVGPLRQLLEQAQDCEILRASLVWLRVPSLVDATTRGIAVACDQGRLGEVLDHWHMLRDPRAVRGLRRLSSVGSLWPTKRTIERMPAGQARGLSSWGASVAVSDSQRVEMWASIRHSPVAAARLSALRGAIQWDDDSENPEAGNVVAGFCNDPEVSIARIALRHLFRRRWDGLKHLLPRLVNSKHWEIRQLASARLAADLFVKLWDRWTRMTPRERQDLAAALIKIDPRFNHRLRLRLSRSDSGSRLRAISIIDGLNQGDAFASQLVRLALDRDEVVASAAVKAVGGVRSSPVAPALALMLRHKDDRVRANTIEALCDVGDARRHVTELVRMSRSDHQRIRANAIGVLLEMNRPQSLKLLQEMLQDVRPEHRISALWLANRAGIVQLAGVVGEMAVTDPSAPVSQRAREVVRRLITLMSQPGRDLAAESRPRLAAHTPAA